MPTSLFFEAHIAFALAGIWMIATHEKPKFEFYDYLMITFFLVCIALAAPIAYIYNVLPNRLDRLKDSITLLSVLTHLFLVLGVFTSVWKKNSYFALIGFFAYMVLTCGLSLYLIKVVAGI